MDSKLIEAIIEAHEKDITEKESLVKILSDKISMMEKETNKIKKLIL